MTSTVSLPRGGVELAGRIAAVHDELQTLARAAQAVREIHVANTLTILADGLRDSTSTKAYLRLNGNTPIKE